MKKISIFLFFVTMVSILFAQDITGTWSGQLNIQGTHLNIVFHIEKSDTVYTTQMDSPDQGAFGLSTTKTVFAGNRIEITADGLGITYTGAVQKDAIVGTFNQAGMAFPLTLKQTEVPQPNRPQEPQPPFPYHVEEITFPNKEAGIKLAGTLTIPDSANIFPAVILIAGSGPNDRDETIFGHKPFLVIADHLTRNGFVVLRYDKRGVGASEGEYKSATTHDFASDAAAAVAYLKIREEIDKTRVGLIGHSEGGVIAPIVAANKPDDIRFIVLMAGMGVKGIDLILDQNETMMKQQHMEPEKIKTLQAINRNIFANLTNWEGTENDRIALRDSLSKLWDKFPEKLKTDKDQFIRTNLAGLSAPGYRHFLAIDPAVYLQKVSCPVLAINGEKDMQVDAEQNLQSIKKAFDKGGNTIYTIKSYPALNHLFQESVSGNVNEYAKIEQTLSPEVLSDITDWIKRQTE